jgi:hypothetical protein
MEVIDDDRRMRQVAADRRDEHRAHVDRHVPDPVAPGRGLLGQPVGDVVGGAALDLTEHPLPAADVGEPDVPPVGQRPRSGRFPLRHDRLRDNRLRGDRLRGDRLRGDRLRGDGRLRGRCGWLGGFGRTPSGPAPADLVDSQHLHRVGGLVQDPLGRSADRVHRGGPGHPGHPAGGGHRRAQPVHDQVTGMLPQPCRDPRAGRDRGHRLGERLAAAPRCTAVPASLAPHQLHPGPALRQVPRPGAHVLLHPRRDHPARRADRRRLIRRRDLHPQRLGRTALHARHRQPVQTQQQRRVPRARTGAGPILIQARSPGVVIA